MDKKPKTGRDTPPKDEEWGYVWSTLDKAGRSWPVTAPFVAVLENWKAMLFVVVLVGALNGPQIIEILSNLWGVTQ